MYMDNKQRLFEMMQKLDYTFHPQKEYYTTAKISFTIIDFIETEVEDRDNYDIKDVNEWISKYHIKKNDKLIWVATKPWIAARYLMNAADWDDAEKFYELNKEKYDKEINVYKANQGTIIEESDDGDGGYLFLFK